VRGVARSESSDRSSNKRTARNVGKSSSRSSSYSSSSSEHDQHLKKDKFGGKDKTKKVVEVRLSYILFLYKLPVLLSA